MVIKIIEEFIKPAEFELINEWETLIDVNKMPKEILDVFTDEKLAENLRKNIFQIKKTDFKEIKKILKKNETLNLEELAQNELSDANFILEKIKYKNWYDFTRQNGVPKTKNQQLKLYIDYFNFKNRKIIFNLSKILNIKKNADYIFFKADCYKQKEAVLSNNFWIEEYEVLTRLKNKVFQFREELIKLTLKNYHSIKIDDFYEKERYIQVIKNLINWENTAFAHLKNNILKKEKNKNKKEIYGYTQQKYILKEDERFLKQFSIASFAFEIANSSNNLKRIYLEYLIKETNDRKAKLLLNLLNKKIVDF